MISLPNGAQRHEAYITKRSGVNCIERSAMVSVSEVITAGQSSA